MKIFCILLNEQKEIENAIFTITIKSYVYKKLSDH